MTPAGEQKQAYTPPRLIRYGRLQAMTQTSLTTNRMSDKGGSRSAKT